MKGGSRSKGTSTEDFFQAQKAFLRFQELSHSFHYETGKSSDQVLVGTSSHIFEENNDKLFPPEEITQDHTTAPRTRKRCKKKHHKRRNHRKQKNAKIKNQNSSPKINILNKSCFRRSITPHKRFDNLELIFQKGENL
ncbi:unnamed protein product [Moneuplotes crassus]|uniref:Uncharacterized protein n=1 Tax=Euplotes crassus TaxID=5936 RepID=A0AAD1U9D0_EUPCR|nr:unnamed protein product [Moneuplotes crassus]